MSRIFKEECAREARHEAYVARTAGAALEGELAIKWDSRGRMYSVKTFALTGETVWTNARSCVIERKAAILTASDLSLRRTTRKGSTRSSFASSVTCSTNANIRSQALVRAVALAVFLTDATIKERKISVPSS